MRIIDSLPGIPMTVEAVTNTLSHMWDHSSSGGGLSDFRASQMNLILHLGLKTKLEEAEDLFNNAVEFAQKYPCRIIVLCPEREEKRNKAVFEGKLFSQCYIGQHLRDLCCCEALILGYSIEESDFLDNQVSLWLESDLPTYHWFHRVPSDRIKSSYLGFLKSCRRILFDSEVEGTDFDVTCLKGTKGATDMVSARSLPFRQHIGQFLSSIEPKLLVEGLLEVNVTATKDHQSLARYLANWQEKAARSSIEFARIDSVDFKVSLNTIPGEASDDLSIDWKYKNSSNYFNWKFCSSQRSGNAKIKLGNFELNHAMHIEQLEEPSVIGEALFFG